MCTCFIDNLVDGLALINLTDSDISTIIPEKVGAARKLCVLRGKLLNSNALTMSLPSNTELNTAQSSLPVSNDPVSTGLSPGFIATLSPGSPALSMADSNNPAVTASPLPGASGVSSRNLSTIGIPKYSKRIQDVLESGNVDLDQFIRLW